MPSSWKRSRKSFSERTGSRRCRSRRRESPPTSAGSCASVRSVHNTQQAQYALLDALTKYVSTCMVEPPHDLLVSARARGKLRYEKLLREAAKTISGESENLLLESVASAD